MQRHGENGKWKVDGNGKLGVLLLPLGNFFSPHFHFYGDWAKGRK